MALRFVDSFNHYNTAALTKKWDAGNGSYDIRSDIQRWTNYNVLRIFSNGVTVTRNLLTSQPTWVIGAAVYFTSDYSSGGAIFSLLDSGTNQCELRMNGTGQLYITRSGTTIVTAGSTTLVLGRWYFLEFKVTINNSTGSTEARINGVTEISGSSLDTQNTANATANQLRLGAGAGAGWDLRYADLYALDGTGGSPTDDFLGDCRVECSFPNGNGTTSQFVGQDSDSTDNYLNVDETSPDSDTTYNESATVGNKDTYAYTDLDSTTGTVYGVAPVPYFRKTNAGSKALVSVARLSGTEVDSASKLVLDTYAYNQDIRETKPGGGAWTISDVNSAEFGIKVTS